MKNYYEILEIDRNASPEVIEKAYRTLVKKYHPDLQGNGKNNEYEEKMKEINEAYSIFTDDYKKSTYDAELKKSMVTKEEYEKILQENIKLKNKLQDMNVQNQEYEQSYNSSFNNLRRVVKEEINRVTLQADTEDIENRRNKHDKEYYIKLAGVILITIFVLFLIYQIPIVKKFFTQLYEENMIFRIIVDLIKNTFFTKF